MFSSKDQSLRRNWKKAETTRATDPGSSIRRPLRAVMARDRRGRGRPVELEESEHLWRARACTLLPEGQVAASMEAIYAGRQGWVDGTKPLSLLNNLLCY